MGKSIKRKVGMLKYEDIMESDSSLPITVRYRTNMKRPTYK